MSRTLLTQSLLLTCLVAGCASGDPSPLPGDAGVDGAVGPGDHRIGAACTAALASVSCAAGEACLEGFVRLTPFDETTDDFADAEGLIMPTGYCSLPTVDDDGDDAGCTADADCGDDAGCFRLPGGPGVCLASCTEDSDCREGDGYRCDSIDAGGSTDAREFCIPDDRSPCASAFSFPSAGTCLLSYDLVGTFEITGTSAGAGDGVIDVGPGRLTIRVTGDGNAPTDGPAGIVCYDMYQQFDIAGVETAINARAFEGAGIELNSGTVDTTTDTLAWDTCTYGTNHGTQMWGPSQGASGAGCLGQYTSVGDVNCTLGAFCAVGGLMPDHNRQDDVWNQPLNTFEFVGVSDPFDRIIMAGLDGPTVGENGPDTSVGEPDDKVEIPNARPSRTWLSFAGTLVSTICN